METFDRVQTQDLMITSLTLYPLPHVTFQASLNEDPYKW